MSYPTFKTHLLSVKHDLSKLDERNRLCNSLQPYIDYCLNGCFAEVAAAMSLLQSQLRTDLPLDRLRSVIESLEYHISNNNLADIDPHIMNLEVISFRKRDNSMMGLLFSQPFEPIKLVLDLIYSRQPTLAKVYNRTFLKDFCKEDIIISDKLTALCLRSSSSFEGKIIVLDFIQPELHSNETFIKLPMLVDDLRQVSE